MSSDIIPESLERYLSAYQYPAFVYRAKDLCELFAGRSMTSKDTSYHKPTSLKRHATEMPLGGSAKEQSVSQSTSDPSQRSSTRFSGSQTSNEAILSSAFGDEATSPSLDWIAQEKQLGFGPERTSKSAMSALRQANVEEDHDRQADEGEQTTSRSVPIQSRPMSDLMKPIWSNAALNSLLGRSDGPALQLLDFLSSVDLQKLLQTLESVVNAERTLSSLGKGAVNSTTLLRLVRTMDRLDESQVFLIHATLSEPFVVVTSLPVTSIPTEARSMAVRKRPSLKARQTSGISTASRPSTASTGSTFTGSMMHSPVLDVSATPSDLATPVPPESSSSVFSMPRRLKLLPEGEEVHLETFLPESDARHSSRRKRTATSPAQVASSTSRAESPAFKHARASSDPSRPLPTPALDSGSPFAWTSPTDPGADPFFDQLRATPVGRAILAFPWHTTCLGSIHSWKLDVRSAVSLVLSSPFRASVWLGEDSVIVYNDEYAQTLAADKHPWLLGKAGSVGFSEAWSELGPIATRLGKGETVAQVDGQVCVWRNGMLEETYHTWTWVPIFGPTRIYFNIAFESTERVIAERRLATIRDVVLSTPKAHDLSSLADQVLSSLSGNPWDLPFVILYQCEKATIQKTKRAFSQAGASQTSFTGSSETQLNAVLTKIGAIGVPDGHPSGPEQISVVVDSSTTPFEDSESMSGLSSSRETAETEADDTVWPFKTVISTRRPVFVEDLKDRAFGFEPRGWLDIPTSGLVLPTYSSQDESVPSLILVAGLNSRRPWNEAYASFVHLLTQQIAAGVMSVLNAERDKRKVEELAALNKARTTFSQNVNHELRTPLQLILGPLEDLISSPSTSSHVRQQLGIIRRNASRLLGMINQLLDLSKIENAQSSYLFRPVKLSALTKDLASLFRSAVESNDIAYIIDCQDDPEDNDLFTVPELYEKVLFNLLSNAYKYTMSGTITVQLRFASQAAILKVIDTGCGIPAAELSQIFERFHRVDRTARLHQGTGIGLALTAEVVKTLGGNADVESEVDVGTTFTVTLPRGASHLKPEKLLRDEPGLNLDSEIQALNTRRRSAVAAVESVTSFHPDTARLSALIPSPESEHPGGYDTGIDLLNIKDSTVLVVDDNADLRAYVAGVLSQNYKVVQFADGESAWEHIQKDPPDLVLSDIMMPGAIDGNELLRAVRSDPKTSLLPFIFISAQAGDEAKAEALEVGADDYLTKPFASRELLARVNVHLQLGKLRSELERRVEERTRELLESEGRYRVLSDRYATLSMLSPVGIFVANSAGEITYVNPRFHEISGAEEDNVSLWRDKVDPADRSKVDDVWSQAMAGNLNSAMAEFKWSDDRGWALLEVKSISDTSGGFVGALTNITIIKQLEASHLQAIEERAADAEAARVASEAFLEVSSHEIRNPLSSVMNAADCLSKSHGSLIKFVDEVRQGEAHEPHVIDAIYRQTEEDVESIDAIAVSAAHQLAIVSDILLKSKLNEIYKMFDRECQRKGIELTLDWDESLDELGVDWINADSVRLSQIALNFLTNAVKYSCSTRRNRISIRAAASPGVPMLSPLAKRIGSVLQGPQGANAFYLSIGVQDEGRGLSSDELSKLFVKFSQARPKTDQYSGSGLGLYVARKLAELQGGFIEVESTAGEGSIFRFVIQVDRASTPALEDLEQSLTASESATIETRQPLRHVLIVEDNLINQKVLARQLRQQGLEVTIANHGQEAIDLLLADEKEHKIDVCLSDIEMPVMDGMAAAREIRKLENEGKLSRRMGLIAVTGNALDAQQQACRENGFDDVATKPYNLVQLVATMESLTGKKVQGSSK